LVRPGNDGWDAYTVLDPSKDNLVKGYKNQASYGVVWNGHTSQIGANAEPNEKILLDSTLTTSAGKEVFKGPTEFAAQQFHFHAGSEHTVDGKRMDLEMHTVHYPTSPKAENNGFIAAAMGIMFSVKEATIRTTVAE
jgi:carbonic anhydrase